MKQSVWYIKWLRRTVGNWQYDYKLYTLRTGDVGRALAGHKSVLVVDACNTHDRNERISPRANGVAVSGELCAATK